MKNCDLRGLLLDLGARLRLEVGRRRVAHEGIVGDGGGAAAVSKRALDSIGQSGLEQDGKTESQIDWKEMWYLLIILSFYEKTSFGRVAAR